jgi:hypothetical protein
MTTRHLSLVALLLIVPMAANAQRRSGGSSASPTGCGDTGRGFKACGGSAEVNKMIKDLADSPSLSKDLQKANPIENLLDKKKDLGLSKDEEKELKTLNDGLKDSVKPFLKTIDSVSKEMKKPGDYAPTQGQMLAGRQLTRESTDSVMAKYREAADAAVAKLTEEHRQPATELLQKEMEAQMSSRRGGRPPV